MLRWLCVAVVLGLAAAVGAKSKQSADFPETPGDLFGLTNVWTVHIHVSKEDWAAMDPARPGQRQEKSKLELIVEALRNRPTTGPSTRPVTRPALAAATRPALPAPRRTRPNGFGFTYTFVPATVEFQGRTFHNVGLRFEGNSSYTSAGSSLRRPYKLNFDRFVTGQKLCSLSTINLHNDAFDQSQMRETMSYYVYRKAGVPAPRTAYAMVYLTVDGVHDHEFLGAYTLVEQVDRKFLRKHFGSDKGLLLKPEGFHGMPYVGDAWAMYERQARPRTAPTTQATKRYIEFFKLIHKADDKEFRQRIGEFIDIDEYLKFVAVTTLVSNMDSILVTDHNFYMYLDSRDGKIRWIPWDLNLAFGAFLMLGTAHQQMELSIDHPFIEPRPLLKRVLDDPQIRERYHQHVAAIIADAYSPAQFAKKAREVQTKVMARATDESRVAGKTGNPQTRPSPAMWAVGFPDLTTFVTGRVHSVVNQLQGASSGYDPHRNRPQQMRPRVAATRPAREIAQGARPTTRRAMNVVIAPPPKSRMELWRDALWPATTQPANRAKTSSAATTRPATPGTH